jgi:hypothetical protein
MGIACEPIITYFELSTLNAISKAVLQIPTDSYSTLAHIFVFFSIQLCLFMFMLFLSMILGNQ